MFQSRKLPIQGGDGVLALIRHWEHLGACLTGPWVWDLGNQVVGGDTLATEVLPAQASHQETTQFFLTEVFQLS